MAACVRVKTPRQIERVGPSTATTHLQLLVLASELIETRSRGGQRELERLVACNDLLHCMLVFSQAADGFPTPLLLCSAPTPVDACRLCTLCSEMLAKGCQFIEMEPRTWSLPSTRRKGFSRFHGARR